MKKIIMALMLVLVLLCTSVQVFAAGKADFVVSASSGKAAPGDEIVITVTASMGSDCSSMGFRPQFDTAALEIVSGECLIKNAVLSDFSKKDGAAVLLESPAVFNGNLCRFTLRVKDGAPAGAIEVGGKCAAKNGGESLQCSIKNAVITIVSEEGKMPEATEAAKLESTEATAVSEPAETESQQVTQPEGSTPQTVPAEKEEVVETEGLSQQPESTTEAPVLTIGANNTAPERKIPVGALVILLLLVAALVGVLVYSRRRK